MQKHSDLLCWIYDDQRLECKSFVPYFSKVNGYLEEVCVKKYMENCVLKSEI